MPKNIMILKKALPLKILDFNTKGKFLWDYNGGTIGLYG